MTRGSPPTLAGVVVSGPIGQVVWTFAYHPFSPDRLPEETHGTPPSRCRRPLGRRDRRRRDPDGVDPGHRPATREDPGAVRAEGRRGEATDRGPDPGRGCR